MTYYGMNFSGAEFGVSTDSSFNWNAPLTWFPRGHYDYFAKKGFNLARLPVSWDQMQPNVGYGLAAPYLAKVKEAIGFANAAGMDVILDVHNYARKNGAVIGSTTVPVSAFADLWKRLAQEFGSNGKVLFGLCNEPHDMATSSWVAAANAAAVAIRDAGAKNKLIVGGNYWNGSASWVGGEMNGFRDPGDNWLIEVHCYLNGNGSGATSDVVSKTVLRDRLTGIVSWCRDNGRKFLLGEFSTGPTDSNAKAAIQDGLTYLANNKDVCAGWSWWACIGAAPPNDPWTPYAVNPSLDYKTEDAKVAWLVPFIVAESTPPPPVVSSEKISVSGNVLACPSDQGMTGWLVQGSGGSVPVGSYPLGIRTVVSFSSGELFVNHFHLSNPSGKYDLTWKEIWLDLRGHSVGSFWDCVVEGTSGIVKITPTAASGIVMANGRNAFGVVVKRQSDPSRASWQCLVTKVVF